MITWIGYIRVGEVQNKQNKHNAGPGLGTTGLTTILYD